MVKYYMNLYEIYRNDASHPFTKATAAVSLSLNRRTSPEMRKAAKGAVFADEAPKQHAPWPFLPQLPAETESPSAKTNHIKHIGRIRKDMEGIQSKVK